jgi:hypothetical protein
MGNFQRLPPMDTENTDGHRWEIGLSVSAHNRLRPFYFDYSKWKLKLKLIPVINSRIKRKICGTYH